MVSLRVPNQDSICDIRDRQYQFNRVPFGLAQAPAYFQTLINKVLDNIIFAKGIPR